MRAGLGAALCAAASLLGASCTHVTDPSKNVTQTFTGTITPAALGGTGQGTPVAQFDISSTGEYTVKVTQMTPTFNNFVGVSLLTASDCSVLVDQRTALIGAQAMAGPFFQTGHYCVLVYELAALGAPMTVVENYSVEVSHP
jgi:hypothetical protein